MTDPAWIDRLDDGACRDDILRLLFVCSDPALPATQQIALALRIVAGVLVKRIATAFLISEAAMEQRIAKAKAAVAAAGTGFVTPDAPASRSPFASKRSLLVAFSNRKSGGRFS